MVATTPRMVATEHHLHAIIDGRGGGGGQGSGLCGYGPPGCRAYPVRARRPPTPAHAASYSLGYGFNTRV